MGCTLKRMRPAGSDRYSMPDGISCVSMAVDQRLQDVMSPSWLDDELTVQQGRMPSDKTLVLNPIGNFEPNSPQNKGKVIDWLMNHYPTMSRLFYEEFDEATRNWLRCGGVPSCHTS